MNETKQEYMSRLWMQNKERIKSMTYKERLKDCVKREDANGAIKLVMDEYSVSHKAASALVESMLNHMFAEQDRVRTTALNKAIDHWYEIYEVIMNVPIGSENCALCNEYRMISGGLSISCKGCPVQERTGHKGCADTPYNEVYQLRKKFMNAAIAEIEFLKSLR